MRKKNTNTQIIFEDEIIVIGNYKLNLKSFLLFIYSDVQMDLKITKMSKMYAKVIYNVIEIYSSTFIN